MDIGTTSLLFTIVVFGAIGCLIASRLSRPSSPWAYVALLVLALVGFYVGVDTSLVQVGDFTVMLNWSIASCCVGGCVGLLFRNAKLRRLANA